MKEFPLFPVKITENDFDKNGETSHGGGVLFPDGVVDIQNKCYLFNIFGEIVQGVIVEDCSMSHIPARLDSDTFDMRQMKVYLLKKNAIINNFIYVSYYVKRLGNEVIFVLARKR